MKTAWHHEPKNTMKNFIQKPTQTLSLVQLHFTLVNLIYHKLLLVYMCHYLLSGLSSAISFGSESLQTANT